MKQKILEIIATLTLVLLPVIYVSAPVFAACSETGSKAQVLNGIGQTGADCSKGDSGVDSIVRTIVQILGIIVGAVAIIMIIVSGFRYITSGGDASRISSAKNTLIYAVIGIAIAVLAQVIVNFTITQSDSAAKACPSGQHRNSSNNCVNN